MNILGSRLTLLDDLRPPFVAPPRARPTFGEALEATVAMAAITHTADAQHLTPWCNHWEFDEPLRLEVMGTLRAAQVMIEVYGKPYPATINQQVIIGRGVGARLVLDWLVGLGGLPEHVPLVVLVDPCLTAEELTPRGGWFNRWYATPLGGRMEPDMYWPLRKGEGRLRERELWPLNWARIHVFDTLTSDPEWFSRYGAAPSSRWLKEHDWRVNDGTMADVLMHVGRSIRRLDKGLSVDMEPLVAQAA